MWTQTGTPARRHPGVAALAGAALRGAARDRAPLREAPPPRAARGAPRRARPRPAGAPPGPLELAGGVVVLAAPLLLWAAFLLAT